jgi:hypothetical protein
LKEQLKLLIELQDIDSAILAMAEKIEQLPARLDQFRTILKDSKDAFEKFQKKSKDQSNKKKDRDHALSEIEDKIDKLKARSREVKTNKEYEAQLKEIEVIEENKGKIEDEILVLMEEIDNYAAELKNEESRVRKAEDEFRAQEKIMNEEIQQASSELEEAKIKRREYTSKIDEDIYNQYLNLLKKQNGLAVVEAKDEVCLGCNRNIPPQLFNNIRKSDTIHKCYYCNRLLYYKEPPPAESKPAEAPPESS